jgi:hypothetical protein
MHRQNQDKKLRVFGFMEIIKTESVKPVQPGVAADARRLRPAGKRTALARWTLNLPGCRLQDWFRNLAGI